MSETGLLGVQVNLGYSAQPYLKNKIKQIQLSYYIPQIGKKLGMPGWYHSSHPAGAVPLGEITGLALLRPEFSCGGQ